MRVFPNSPKPTLLLYRCAQFLSLPFFAVWLLARLLRHPTYRGHVRERCGILPDAFCQTKAGSIWLHAVSVGEVISALPLIRELKASQPAVPVFLSTSTVAGRKAALAKGGDLVAGVFYAPYDFVFAVRRVISTLRPALLIVLETEIWPNLYAEVKRSGAQLAILNGRISDRSWPRYRQWRSWFRPVLQLADFIGVQSSEDLKRYLELGANPDCTQIAPNLKYDAAGPASGMPAAIETYGAQHIWIAASTVGPAERGSLRRHTVDEDVLVLNAFKHLAEQYPRLLLILAPRQPQRFDEVSRLLASRNVRYLRRSQVRSDPSLALELPGVLLLDTIGELAGLYPLADVAFVGGSLAPRGGHNILEPAAAGVPVVVGPHMQNFAAIARDFSEADAFIQIGNSHELAPVLSHLMDDRASARQIGERGRWLVESRRGGAAKLARQVWLLYHSASVRANRHWLVRALLIPLAGLWKEGGTLKRWRSERFTLIAPPLNCPVISVGGLTVGGSGKTPFTVFLASRLRARGYTPAILTRGYRRQLPAETIVLPAGAKLPSVVTGDEAQIFLRAGDAPVGIGAKRYETAQVLLDHYPGTDVLVLDDGFQHARMLRDANLAIIDGLDPFGGDEVVPLGRLREPVGALVRADIFVVNRADDDLRFEAISRRLRAINPAAPVFRTRQVARSWHDYFTGKTIPDLRGRRVGAFCALGNPQSFWRTLASQSLEVVFRWHFPDHHVYTPLELERVAHQARLHGAEVLVTTEKDRINCPGSLARSIAPLDLAWLEIELLLEDEAGFFSAVEDLLARTQNRDRVTRRTAAARSNAAG